MKKRALLTLLSAIFIVLSFPPYGLVFLLPFSLAPWLHALDLTEKRSHRFFLGLLLSLFVTLMGFHWVAYVLKEFGNLSWGVAGLLCFLFGFGCQPQFPIFALFRKPIRSSEKFIYFLFGYGALYTALDFLSPKLFRDSLGHSLYSVEGIRQVSELTGIAGLTLLVYFLSESSLFAWRERKFKPLIFCILLATAGSLFGHLRLIGIRHEIEKAKIEKRELDFAVIQANIGDLDKFASRMGLNGAAERVVGTYLSLSEEAVLKESKRPDAIIWPETAYPSLYRNPTVDTEYSRDLLLEKFSKKHKVPLFFGGYDRENKLEFNAFFFLTPEGDLTRYHKSLLLPFGEELPFLSLFPSLKSTFPQVANFGRGDGPEALPLPISGRENLIKASPLICYEVLDAPYVWDSVKKGADFLLNITNDSWFGPWGEPHLHLALSVFRSIETRRTLLRATNTGFSALILPDGSIVQRTSLNEPVVFRVQIPLVTPSPKFGVLAWGNAFSYFLILCAAWFLISRCRKSRQIDASQS